MTTNTEDMKDLTKEEQEKLYNKTGEIIESIEGHCQRKTVEDIGAILLSEIRTAVERERERIFTHLVKADMSEFMRNPDRTDPIHKSFYNGTNAMLTILQRYIDSLK